MSGPFAKIEDVELSKWSEVINVDLIGSLIVLQTILRYADSGAVLINVTSAASFLLFGPELPAYSVSKAAAVALSQYPHFERPGLRCVSIRPG